MFSSFGALPFFASLNISPMAAVKPLFGSGFSPAEPAVDRGSPRLACAVLIPRAHEPYQIWMMATPPQAVDRVWPGWVTRAVMSEWKRTVGEREVLWVILLLAELRMNRIASSWSETFEM